MQSSRGGSVSVGVFIQSSLEYVPVRVAQGVEAWLDSTRLVQRIAGSNPASGVDVCVRLCMCNFEQ